RKRRIPALPARIAIVTSPTGAAIRDILNILRRRHDGLSVTIYPVRVQGGGSAADVAEGIRRLNGRGDFDVLIVARGGGSPEDLAPFNDERVARALAASRIPTISAIGHESDVTIADLVADLRAPTPSAAAELVVERKDALVRRLSDCRGRVTRALRSRLGVERGRLTGLSRAGGRLRFRDRVGGAGPARFEVQAAGVQGAGRAEPERARPGAGAPSAGIRGEPDRGPQGPR